MFIIFLTMDFCTLFSIPRLFIMVSIVSDDLQLTLKRRRIPKELLNLNNIYNNQGLGSWPHSFPAKIRIDTFIKLLCFFP